jgi:hypothetical protein
MAHLFTKHGSICSNREQGLIINSSDLVIREKNESNLLLISPCAISNHHFQTLGYLPPNTNRPMLPGLVRNIQRIKQSLLSCVVAHGPPFWEDYENGLEMHHFPPPFLDKSDCQLLHNQISTLSVEDSLILNMLIGAEVVKFTMLHLPDVSQRLSPPRMLV